MTVDIMSSLLSAITRIADTYPTQEGGQVGIGMGSPGPTPDSNRARRAAHAAQKYLETRRNLLKKEAAALSEK
ncbi:hypothetical protein [Pyruvatibacter sp.]